MSLSYSALVNHGKVTLPSVSDWGTNMNILRDPPKSIMTRRIDKISETSGLTQMVDESTDRACEAIQVYARGVNPFVSVSYSNYGNNGGQRSGNMSNAISTIGQAKLPYSIMKDGAFRPPVLFGENLLPLSRLPRNLTHAKTKASFVDFSRKIRSCGTAENTREVKNTTLKAHIRPTAVYKMEKPLRETFEVKYSIQPTINNSANSGVRSIDITKQYVGRPTKEIDLDPLHAHARSNLVGEKRVNNNNLETERYLQDRNHYAATTNISSILENSLATNNTLEANRYLQNSNHHTATTNISSILENSLATNNTLEASRYLQDTNYHAVGTNMSSNKQTTSIENILDLTNIPVKEERINIQANAGIHGTEQTKYIHDDIHLDRRMPEYNATTNIGDSTVYKNIEYENELNFERNIPMSSFTANPMGKSAVDLNSREARLAPKIQAGGFEGKGQIPMLGRTDYGRTSGISEKARMNSMVFNAMQSRQGNPPPFM